MALHTCRVVLERRDSHLFGNLLRLRLTMQSQKSLVVRRLFPYVNLSSVAFRASVGTDDEGRALRDIDAFVARIRK